MERTLLAMQRFGDGGGCTLPAGSVLQLHSNQSRRQQRKGGGRRRVIEERNRWTHTVCLLNRPQNEGKYTLPWRTVTHGTQGCRQKLWL